MSAGHENVARPYYSRVLDVTVSHAGPRHLVARDGIPVREPARVNGVRVQVVGVAKEDLASDLRGEAEQDFRV